MNKIRKAAGRVVGKVKRILPDHTGWCWACDFGRHQLGDDSTCPCCRNGHNPDR